MNRLGLSALEHLLALPEVGAGAFEGPGWVVNQGFTRFCCFSPGS